MTRDDARPDVQIDAQKWMGKLVDYWWLFLLGLLISIPSGYFYLRYATFEYSTRAKLLIKDVGQSGILSESGILAEELGLNRGGKDMDNEIQILKSRPILTKTIERIGANITYIRLGRIKNTELYSETPVLLDSFRLAEGLDKTSFFVEMDYYDQFEFRKSEEGPGTKHQYGELFENQFGQFSLSRNLNGKFVPGIYQINIYPAEDIATYYNSKLMIEVVGSTGSSSILELKLIDEAPHKAEDLLNTLINVYNEEEIDDDTKVLRNTIDFIDERVKNLTAELNEVEGDIERFKRDNSIITSNAVASMDFALTELRSSLATLSSYEVEDQLLLALQESLTSDNFEEKLIPANIGTTNTALVSLINQYNDLFLQRDRLSLTLTADNPVLANVIFRLKEIRGLITRSIDRAREDLKIPIARTEQEIAKLRSSIQTVPTVEKSLLEKLRTQSIKESLFLFLLQRREETALSAAVTTANTRVIESARSSKSPVYPRKNVIYLGAILLGLFVPFLIISLKSLFENVIDSEEMIGQITSIPIVGRIAHHRGDEKILVGKFDRSVISEMFRLLRTNLTYTNLKQKKQILLVTSSVSSEGKSVIAVNLGLTISLANKKVLILDLDLRKPRVAEYLNVDNKRGVTTFLIGEHTLDEVIQGYPDNENLFLISSGPIPPNPAELLLSDQIKVLMESVKERFDFVIIDSPPIGVVADALLLRDYITNMLLVVRHKQTRIAMLRQLEQMHKAGELISPSLVLNDIQGKRGFYGYSSYNYGYGKGYYSTDK